MAVLAPLLAALHLAPADDPPDNAAVNRALISEIWMLVDFVAGSSSQGLAQAVVMDPAAPANKLTPTQLLQGVSNIEAAINANQPGVQDRAFLQVVRDALNLLIAPATGLTVAYSSMVTGPLRGRSASRFALARQAYSNLPWRARGHRALSSLILVGALLCTGVAVWESAKVALGKALLQNMDLLRTQQAALNIEKVKLEMSQPAGADAARKLDDIAARAKVPLASYRICDRASVRQALLSDKDVQEYIRAAATDKNPRLLAYASTEERDVCGRDDILRSNLDIVHGELVGYSANWPSMVGSVFASVRNFVVCRSLDCPGAGWVPLDPKDDIEFRVAPVLLVWGNFVLPIIFGLIGSAIFVMLDNYNKVRNSLLHPRDTFLAPVRLAMGLIVGACVGLFFSASGPMPGTLTPAPASALLTSLTLTASGVAFLAGFGVETVFTMLQSLIDRVFVTSPGK